MKLRFAIVKIMEKLAAMNAHFRFPLMNLPNELIAHIVEQLRHSIKSLRRLSRTCRRIQILTEPVLYRSLFIRTGARTEEVLNSLTARSGRGTAVHYVDLPCDPSCSQNFEAIAGLLTRARNLKELMIESPECNTSDFENEEAWTDLTDHLFEPFQAAIALTSEAELSKRPLQKLKKLTLHLNGSESPYWTVDAKSLPILLHPTLQHLKMSCVNILDDIVTDSHLKSPTPLRHLELVECNITHKGLSGILSLPKALETLYLGENCHNVRYFAEDVDPACNHLFQTNAAAAVAALSQQQSSLKSLTYVTTETYYQHLQLTRQANSSKYHIDAGFRYFHSLEHVSLIGQCPDFERALMTSRSPPSLQSLTCKAVSPFRRDFSSAGDQDTDFSLVPFLRAPSCSIPESLTNLDVTYDAVYVNFQLSETTRTFIEAAAKATAKIGIKLRAFSRRQTTYFPPYLYGELEPGDEMIFTGLSDGWVGKFRDGFWAD